MPTSVNIKQLCINVFDFKQLLILYCTCFCTVYYNKNQFIAIINFVWKLILVISFNEYFYLFNVIKERTFKYLLLYISVTYKRLLGLLICSSISFVHKLVRPTKQRLKLKKSINHKVMVLLPILLSIIFYLKAYLWGEETAERASASRNFRKMF